VQIAPSYADLHLTFMAIAKSLLNTPADHTPNTQLTIDGIQVPGHAGGLLIDLLNERTEVKAQKAIPQVCYVPQMGPIQSCDTCMVKVNGELVRAGCRHRSTRGVRPHSAEPHAVLHGVRQQQRKLHDPQHDGRAGCEASGAALQAEAVREGHVKSVLSL
jgi:predicted molibdopterin-dependent oxidoreductase YjgC